MADLGRSAGRVLIRPLGAYDPTVTYEMLDSVEYEGTSYLCKTTSLGHLPTDTDYWQKLAKAADPLTILDSEGTAMPQRSNLQFANATVTDDATNDATVITTSGGGGGLHIGDVDNFASASTAGVQKITLTWDDPDDIVISGVVQAAWGGTKIVRKAGSIPISDGDGTIVVNSTTRNQYSVTGFEDNTVEFDTTYYYRAFPYTTEGTVTDGSNVSAMVKEYLIFGVEWNGTATPAWTRTDDAVDFTDPVPYYSGMSGNASSPFDTLYPWSEIERVADAKLGTMVKIPKFYCKIDDTQGLKIQISRAQFEGSWISPAHMDRGDGQGERDNVYIGAYKTTRISQGGGVSSYESRTGKTPINSASISNFRTWAQSMSGDTWCCDIATLITIWMLYLVEFASWDSQGKIGYGCSPSNAQSNTGACDSLPYHTGTSANNRSTYGHVVYRYIEDLWANGFEGIDGIYKKASTSDWNFYIEKNPNNFNNSQNGTDSGMRWPDKTGHVFSLYKKPSVLGLEWLFLPTSWASDLAYSSYSCDSGENNYRCTDYFFGARYAQSQEFGLFYLEGKDPSTGGTQFNFRLMKLPANT